MAGRGLALLPTPSAGRIRAGHPARSPAAMKRINPHRWTRNESNGNQSALKTLAADAAGAVSEVPFTPPPSPPPSPHAAPNTGHVQQIAYLSNGLPWQPAIITNQAYGAAIYDALDVSIGLIHSTKIASNLTGSTASVRDAQEC